MLEFPLSVVAEFAKYGLLGAILIVVGWIAWQLKQDLIASWTERLADWKSLQTLLSGFRATMSELSASSDARTRAQEASARSQELAAQAAITQASEIERLRQEVGTIRAGNIDEVDRFREEVRDLRNAIRLLGEAMHGLRNDLARGYGRDQQHNMRAQQ